MVLVPAKVLQALNLLLGQDMPARAQDSSHFRIRMICACRDFLMLQQSSHDRGPVLGADIICESSGTRA